MRKLLFILLSISIFIIGLCGGLYLAMHPFGDISTPFNSDWSDADGTICTDIPYGEESANRLDLYLPADKSKANYGLVVYIHAGGFTSGDKKDDSPILRSFTKRGYVATGINYTLRSAENSTATITSMSLEIKKGIEVACEQATKKGYNLHGMAVCGGSAGGCLALIYAYRDAESAPIPVRCCIEMVGPTTFEPSVWYGQSADYSNKEIATAAALWCNIMTGDNITAEMMANGEYKKFLVKISPYLLVNENTVPTLAGYGALDRVCTPISAKYLEEALTKYGVKHDVIIFPNSGHGLNRDKQQAKIFFQKFEEYLDTYLPIEK